MNLISVTFHPLENMPTQFLTLIVSSCISLFVDVSYIWQVPLIVPTTSHSPSRENAKEEMIEPVSTQSITFLCFMLQTQAILSKLPVAKVSSLSGLKDTLVTKDGIENI